MGRAVQMGNKGDREGLTGKCREQNVSERGGRPRGGSVYRVPYSDLDGGRVRVSRVDWVGHEERVRQR